MSSSTSTSSPHSPSSIPLKVPRRPFGELYDNPRLPATVPIVGLGCSSFSTFFWTKADHEELKSAGGDGCSSSSSSNDDDKTKEAHGWTAETLHRHHPKVQEWIETIRYAIIECGITLLDTAPWYGHGTSEVVLGWALPDIVVKTQENNNSSGIIQRSDLTINTKVGRYQADPQHQFDYTFDTTIQSVDRSLQRMNLTYIDVLQLHDPEFSPSLSILLEQTIPAMIHCQQQGKCKALGMTGYPLQVQHLIFQKTIELLDGKTSSPHGIWDQALTYGHYNLHDTSLMSQPLSLRQTLSSSSSSSSSSCSFAQYCQNHRIALLAAAPLSLGLLTPQGPPVWHPACQELQEACAAATTLASQHNVNIATLAMVVALAHPQIPCTILGMKNVTEVQSAMHVANRFHNVSYSVSHHSAIDDMELSFLPEVLSQVLTEPEFQVWKLLQDPEQGPFAQVWKNGNYRWDWMQHAKEFWKQVEGVEFEEWANEP